MEQIIKRIFDFSVAFIGIFMLMPVYALIYIILLIKIGPPVFFKQKRPGLNGHPFVLIKFRTMINTQYINGQIIPDKNRLTSFGLFLRSTSLDELPELFNVLKGQMSLVGPRPLMGKYLNRYTPFQARRHEVKPGITGWAQINGRNNISWEERFKLDVWYVDHRSLMLDLKIIFRTFVLVLTRSDVNQNERATVDEFFGTEQNQSAWPDEHS